MDENKTSWPLIIGVTAGVIGAIVAVSIYSMKHENASTTKLRDAKEIIEQCNNTIKEIESTLEALNEPS